MDSWQQRKRTPSRSLPPKKTKRPRPILRGYVPRGILRDLNVLDTSALVGSAAGGWSYASLFNPVQGTATANRFGDKTLVTGIQYFININAGATIPYRLIFYYDRQPNGANPTSPAPMLGLDQKSFKDPDLRYRFQILRDFYICNPSNVGIETAEMKQSNFQRGFIKCALPTTFSGNLGTIADIRTGSIGMCWFNGSTDGNSLTYAIRFLFKS